ncbi:hypothetical protein Bhyg_07819 [Pseudolycoriella hygida]|uniref:Uncharacterized protein n=1 Tax=Pseudolycoriella hygida TaxID=35572 RepID=A0A9Q0N3E6_9DIPT|nr:hypothetical protein Bhyg_07819 [Pseudolycoriella hygida]
MSSSPAKTWTEKGPEQKELERMFKNKLVDEAAAPNKIRQAHPLFMAHSARVLAAHFCKTRAKFGAYATDDHDDCEIPELGTSNAKQKLI